MTNARLRARFANRHDFHDAWSDAEETWLRSLEHHVGELRENHAVDRHRRHSHANVSRLAPQLQPNDLVVVRDIHRPPGVAGKIRRPYVGPWVIDKVRPNQTLVLKDLDGHNLPRSIPADHVRLWRPRSAITQPPSRGGGCNHPGYSPEDSA